MFDYVTKSELESKLIGVEVQVATKADSYYVDRIECCTNELTHRTNELEYRADEIQTQIVNVLDSSHRCRICLKQCDQFGICEDCARRLRTIFFPTPVGMDEII